MGCLLRRLAATSSLWLASLVVANATIFAVHAQSTENDNEFSTRETPEFSLPPSPGPGQRFLTAEGHIEGFLQYQGDWSLESLADLAPWRTLYGEGESRINVNFGQHFSINTLLRFERGDYPTYSAEFASEVLYVQRLFGVVHLKPVHIYAGKIHPRFGIGWYYTPGLYGSDFDTDYELYEKLGGGVRIDIRRFGRHRFTAEAFQTDTSFLQTSLIPGTRRPTMVNLADGGAGNTGTFESFALALSGEQIPYLPGFSYQVGWAKQKAAPTDVRDEYSWSAAAVWSFPLWNKNVTLEPMVEWVSVSGQGGFDRNANYLTVAATLRLGEAWSVGIHTTQRYVSDFGQDQYRTDSLVGIGIAYQFVPPNEKWRWLDGLSAIVGFRDVTSFETRFQTLGAQIKYQLDF